MKERPSILHVVTDQQRFDTIHAAGNPHIFTPHLNWLMDTGTIFRRAYTDAPSCVPARATMITGTPFYRMPHGYGGWGMPTVPDPAQTVPGLLTAAGYQTRAIGKLHFNPPRCRYGFEHAELLEDYYRARRAMGGPQPRDHGLGENEMEPAISTVSESESLTHWTAERAVNFIETRDPTRPFYLQLSFAKPHPPFDPPLNYWQLYQNRSVPDPILGDWSANARDIPAGFLGPTVWLNGADRFSPEQWRHICRAYYACITQIDYNLGLLLARMRELNLLENTLIVFHSDHGEMLGDHHMGAKTTFLEGSAHVPMLARWPREIEAFRDLEPGSSCDSLVTLADLMPTFLAAADVPMPAEQTAPGLDLATVHRRKIRRAEFIGAHETFFARIEGDWKYHYTSAGGGELLFNLTKDPGERHNLAEVHPEICADMQARLAEKLGQAGYAGLSATSRKLPIEQSAKAALQRRQDRCPGLHSSHHSPEDVRH